MRLPALEKNILVFRALQMALFLFYSEDLRRHIVETVASPHSRHNFKGLKGAKLLIKIFETLTDEKVITAAESKELQDLLRGVAAF